MKLFWLFAIVIFCLPLCAEEKEVWPEFPVSVIVGASPERLVITADLTIANIRFRRDYKQETDQVAMSFRVIGKGTRCLDERILLGIGAKQAPFGLSCRPYNQELYFQIHYLTDQDSIRYFHPLSINNNWQPQLEIEKLHLGRLHGMEIFLRGELNSNDINIGIGLARKIGDHIEIRVFTNDPKLEIFFKYNLLDDH